MSTAGQVAGGVVGAVAGFFIGGGPTGALYGAQIGLALGGYLDPPRIPDVHGPRLSDLSVQSSTYGAVIPRVYGAVTVTGNVIWLEGNAIKETVTRSKSKSGGKGGSKKTTTRTYSYSATFAVGLCQGPIIGVRRIWIGADLWYDAGALDSETIIASNQNLSDMALYLGADSQSPDPRIQADKGVGNTSSWPGLVYLVFYDLPLAKYGNSLAGAQVKVELLQNGSTVDYPYATSTVSNAVYTAPVWSGSVFCAMKRDAHTAVISTDGLAWSEHTVVGSGPTNYQGVATDGAGTLLAYGPASAGIFRSTDGGVSWTAIPLPGGPSSAITHIGYGNGTWLAVAENGLYYAAWYTSTDGGQYWVEQANTLGNGSIRHALLWHAGSAAWYLLKNYGANRGVYKSTTGLSGSWTLVRDRGTEYWANADTGCVHKGRLIFLLDTDIGTSVLWSDDGAAWAISAAPERHLSILSDGDHAWILGGQRSASPTVPSGYYSIDGVSGWTAWDGPSSVVLQFAGYGNTLIACLPYGGAVGYRIAKTFASAIDVSLGLIISAECLSSGLLTAGDIDVSALTSLVHGYRVGSIGSLRSVLEPLQAAWPFDVRQHGYKLEFVPRGGSAVTTIAAADLDARTDGDKPGVQIGVAREMDSQLPRRVTLRFIDRDREYDTGEQYAERLNTAAHNLTLVDLPLVMTSDEAAQKAEVLLYLYWMERNEIVFRLPPTYLQLECGDVVTLPTPEGAVDVRLTAISYTADGRLECRGKPARGAVYTSTAAGVGSAVTGATAIGSAGKTYYVLLDVPRLSSAQDGAALLAVAYGTTIGWPGGVIMQSTDSGGNWYQVAEFARPGAAVGSASNTLGAADARVIDAAGVLTVTLSSGDLYSVSEASLLAGENHFAYGAPGRWEIIAARTCTLVSGKTYTLSNLLRGRFGSEDEMTTHVGGDMVIQIDAADLAVIALSSAAIGVPYLYRGITVDADIGTDVDRTATYAAVNLRPLSPVLLNGARDPASNDWTLNWTRRTRSGGEWRDAVDADLGEATESYAIDIHADGTYATIKRTLTAVTASVTYSSADQVLDFGSNQATLYVGVCQVSATVGRGRALKTAITR